MSSIRAAAWFSALTLHFAFVVPVFGLDGPVFHFTEKPGPYPVGVKVVEQYDYSRTFRRATNALGQPYLGERARPVQTLVWYPAERGNTAPMTVGDYVNLWATETTFGHPNLSAKAKEWLTAMKLTLAMPLWAVRDAAPKSGRFPVLIYAPGAGGTAWENADLCEYLASHGYVIVASPSRGATTKVVSIDLVGIDAQARDISFLISYAQTLPDTDMSQVAVAGMSWGGIANVFAASRDNRIRALITLDGSMRYYPGYIKRAGDVHPEQMTIPLMAFIQRNFSLEDQDHYSMAADLEAPNVLNAWTHGDLFAVHMLGLCHGFFTSLYQRNEDTWWELDHVWPTMQDDYSREDAITGYAWTARYALHFLDAYLKHDEAALSYLKKSPSENGAPPHVMAVSYRAATGAPVSFEAFRSEVIHQGFDHAADVYAAFLKRKPDFKVDDRELMDWSDELIDENHLPEATSLLRLNVQMRPESSGGYASLADAYRISGETQLAIENYKKALEKDPMNGAAARRLEQLGVTPTATHGAMLQDPNPTRVPC